MWRRNSSGGPKSWKPADGTGASGPEPGRIEAAVTVPVNT